MIKNIIFELREIFVSVFELKLKHPELVWAGGFSIGTFTGMVEDWLFSPAGAFIALMVLIVCDWLTGLVLAIKRQNFKTHKAWMILWTLIGHIALLYFATNLSTGSIALSWLDEGVFTVLATVNLLSLVKNLSLLGIIKKKIAEWFYKNVDKHKNIIEDDGNTSG